MDYITFPVRGIQNEDGSWSYGALTRKQINALDTPFLNASLRLYTDFQTFNILPHGNGTLGERRTVLDIIKILKGEENAFNSWEMEQKMNS